MDPITLFAFVSAMMASISVWQQERNYRLTKQQFDEAFQESLDSAEIVKQAELAVGMGLLPPRTLHLLSRRVEECWDEFDRRIDPDRGSVDDPAKAEPDLADCLCTELRAIKRLHGNVPPGPFRDWWNNYACGPYIAAV